MGNTKVAEEYTVLINNIERYTTKELPVFKNGKLKIKGRDLADFLEDEDKEPTEFSILLDEKATVLIVDSMGNGIELTDVGHGKISTIEKELETTQLALLGMMLKGDLNE